MQREYWYVTNNTQMTISIDLDDIPSFDPGQTYNLLDYTTKEKIEQNAILKNLLSNGTFTLTRNLDSDSATFEDPIEADESGVETVTSDLQSHTSNTNNPHNTTPAQISADPLGAAATVQINLNQHTGDAPIHFTEASISHANILNVGTNTHAQIDSHLSSTANPHTTTLEQARTANAQLSGDIDADSNTIINLKEPEDALDAATKAYVDAVATGLSIKASCRVATTEELTANYSGVGKTLTATGNGAVTIDVVELASTNRVLVKNQSTSTQNGIYTVTTVGDGSNPYVLTRATDYDISAEMSNGNYVFVTEGTNNANSAWVMTTPNPITLDSSNIVWTQFSQQENIAAGDGLGRTGNTIFAKVDDSTIEINTDQLRVKDAGITNAKLDKTNIPLSGFGAAGAAVSLGSQKITNLASPTASTDAVNKAYSDWNLVSVTTTHTAVIGTLILADTSSGAFTITLPSATLNDNRKIAIKKVSTDGRTVTIQCNGAETIDGQNSGKLDGYNDCLEIVSDGSNWYIK